MSAKPLVGVVGGGEVARLLALAAEPLGLTCRFIDSIDDLAALERNTRGLSVATFADENGSITAARELQKFVHLSPTLQALAATQDRVLEKQLLKSLGIWTAPFASVESAAGLKSALNKIGYPAILKPRVKSDSVVRSVPIGNESELEGAFKMLGGVPGIVEGVVKFERELLLLAVRGLVGESGCYALAENVGPAGSSIAPARDVALELEKQARGFARRIMEALAMVGMMRLNLFQVGGYLLAHGIGAGLDASGNWTLGQAQTSQYENHLRAITGLELGSCDMRR